MKGTMERPTQKKQAEEIFSKGSLLRELREKQGLSQRTLSEKAGISRGRLRRLEGRQFELATYGELKRITHALGIELGEIFDGEDLLTPGFSIGKAGQTAFEIDARNAGYKIVSFLSPRPDLFSGKLFVSGGRQVPSNQVPCAEKIFLQMLLGSLRIFVKGETHEIEEGDSFLFCGDAPYTIENSLSRDSVALILTVPAFALHPE